MLSLTNQSSFVGAGDLWNWLQNLVGVSNQISWVAIGITSYRFRKGLKIQGRNENELPFLNKTYPWGPGIVIVLNIFLILGKLLLENSCI